MHFLINHPELQDNIVDTLKVSNFKNIMGHCRQKDNGVSCSILTIAQVNMFFRPDNTIVKKMSGTKLLWQL